MTEAIISALLGGIISLLLAYFTVGRDIAILKDKKIKEAIKKVIEEDKRLIGIVGKTQIEIGEIDTHEAKENKGKQLGYYIATEDQKIHKQYIKFKTKFLKIPNVVVALSLIDSQINIKDQKNQESLRINVKAEDITENGFNFICSSWSSSKSYQAKAIYTALTKNL